MGGEPARSSKCWSLAVAASVPFGGVGDSGVGRENGLSAIDEYTETKAVWVELTGGTRDPFTLG